MVSCRECGQEFKRINVFHLKKHGLNEKSYKEKHPDAELFSLETRMLISERTKEEMHRPESWELFKAHIATRDYIGEKNPFYGKQHTDKTKQTISRNEERASKISAEKAKWWALHIGQTIEQLYGEETGKRVRKLRSEQAKGERNPAYGRVYENAGWKVGRYKGKLFRSLYEYSFYKYLEQCGIDLKNVQHEPFAIPYVLRGRKRTYTPDFLITDRKQLIEIKSTWELMKRKGRKMREAKFAAANAYCHGSSLQFIVMTEKDFRVFNFSVASRDPHVDWIKSVRRNKR